MNPKFAFLSALSPCSHPRSEWIAKAPFSFPLAGPVVSGLQVERDIPGVEYLNSRFESYELVPGIREIPITAIEADPEELFHSQADLNLVKIISAEIKSKGKIAPIIVTADQDGLLTIITSPYHLGALWVLRKPSFPALIVLDK